MISLQLSSLRASFCCETDPGKSHASSSELDDVLNAEDGTCGGKLGDLLDLNSHKKQETEFGSKAPKFEELKLYPTDGNLQENQCQVCNATLEGNTHFKVHVQGYNVASTQMNSYLPVNGCNIVPNCCVFVPREHCTMAREQASTAMTKQECLTVPKQVPRNECRKALTLDCTNVPLEMYYSKRLLDFQNGMKPVNHNTTNCSPVEESVQGLLRSHGSFETDVRVHRGRCADECRADWQLINQYNRQAGSLAVKGEQIRDKMYNLGDLANIQKSPLGSSALLRFEFMWKENLAESRISNTKEHVLSDKLHWWGPSRVQKLFINRGALEIGQRTFETEGVQIVTVTVLKMHLVDNNCSQATSISHGLNEVPGWNNRLANNPGKRQSHGQVEKNTGGSVSKGKVMLSCTFRPCQ